MSWLPHALTNSDFTKIFKSLSKDVEIIGMQDCYYTRDDIKHVKRPAKLVKIKYLRSLSKNVNISTGVFKLYEGVNILIQKLGEKPKCLLCGQHDHLKKDCPLKNTFCKKCNKRGHEASGCSFATRLVQVEALIDLPDEATDSDLSIVDRVNSIEKSNPSKGPTEATAIANSAATTSASATGSAAATATSWRRWPRI